MAVMLLEWVLTSIFLILVVLALRAALGKRVSARLRYALWAVVLVRLLVPVQLFTSPIAGTRVFSENRTEKVIYKVDEDLRFNGPEEDAIKSLGGQDGPSVALTTAPGVPPNAPTVPDAPEPPAAPDLTKAPAWLGWLWLAGSVAAALVLLASNLRFYWRLRRERIPLETADCPLRVYAAVDLPSPCLLGILRPAIYVTPDAAADPDMLRHVLAHEYTHYKHGDHIWSLLRCVALAVHWWDPLVWAAAVLSQRDAELACDEGALKRLGDGERAGYGNTLLALVTAKPRPGDLFRCATTMAGDKKSLKERVTRIAKAPQRWLWAAVAVVLVTALACVCAFGQAAEDSDGPEPDPAPSAPAESEAPDLDLSFSIDEYGNVAISGTVDGLTLGENTYWHPAADAEHPITYLALESPPAIAGDLEAWWWDDDGRTSVMVSTAPTVNKFAGDDLNAGFWSFTVDLSKGVVTDMTLVTATPAQAEGTELHAYPERISDEEAVAAARLAAELMTAAEDYYRSNPPELYSDEWVEHRVLMFQYPDLNRDGVPETIATSPFSDGMGMRVGVWQGVDVGNYDAEWWDSADLLWTDEGCYAHAGWESLFLCDLSDQGGGEYLLRYHPTMYGGTCTYTYELFTLENGQETVVRGNSVEFDINFQPWIHQSFDPEAIAAFMDEVNGLLAHSVQLLNTDENLVFTFEKEGRLYDSLGWLDWDWGNFARDPSKSLLENLQMFKETREKAAYANTPTVFPVDELGTDIRLDYRDKSARFQSPGWDYGYQPAEHVEPKILDLNGDGRDEIVFALVWGHGTGAYIEKLYVFDAETLEQYDTSGLNKMIHDSFESTGDEENFYLSGAGLDVTIPKSEAGGDNPNAPIADAISFEEVIRYTIEDGKVFCWLGCDASGALINYIGYINVQVWMTPSGEFVCGGAQYVAGDPF